MLLLTGPPGAGKTAFCIEQLRECLRARRRDCILLTPTTTLAEHLRNQLAREGFLLSPDAVRPFGRYVDDLAAGLPPAGAATLELMVARELERSAPARYAAVKSFPGFRSALVNAIQEFAGAGGLASHITDADFAQIYTAVEAELKRRGLYLRAARLRHAAAGVRDEGCGARTIWIAGFYAFTAPEAELVTAMGSRCELVVTLPEASLPADEVRRFDAPSSRAERVLVTAPTPDAEAVDIARRILKEAETGRPFREMGVLIRSERPGLANIRSAFERFDIPARFYFAPRLNEDATVRYLLALLDAAAGGWDHEASIAALRMHGSPMDRFGDGWEHRALAAAPGRGLEGLKQTAPKRLLSFLDQLETVTSWMSASAPGGVWARRMAALRGHFSPGAIADRPTQQQLEIWRSQAAALEGFTECATEAAQSFEPNQLLQWSEFRVALQTTLRTATVRTVDHRRDVVHVMDAFEARQWKLPIVFVSGLLEGEFPRHHSEDPVLPDDARRRLRAHGVVMKTAVDRQADEVTLFHTVLACASERLYLSYPALNGKGEPNLPSFLLAQAQPYTREASAAVRPTPLTSRGPEPDPAIYADDLRLRLAERHAALSPSGVETFLQCPFQFFAERTLRLGRKPADPWSRLDASVQGTIAHRTLERHFRDGVPVECAFEEAYAAEAGKLCLPDGYRIEAVRLELLYSIQLLAQDGRVPRPMAESAFETDFAFALGEGTAIRGRMDRMDVDAEGRAVVFDYKYRRKARLRESVAGNEDGTKVQGGLYLAAAEALGYTPAGMVYLGFKREVGIGGWVLPPLYPQLQSTCSPAHIAEVMHKSKEVAMDAAAAIRQGRIVPDPEDATRCDFCRCRTMCRVEVVAEAEVLHAAE